MWKYSLGDCSLDDETRGFIESLMDEMFTDEIVEDVKWVQEDIPISSLAEVALGYVIGYLRALAHYTIALRTKHLGKDKRRDERVEKEIWKIIKRRLPEIGERINKELNR